MLAKAAREQMMHLEALSQMNKNAEGPAEEEDQGQNSGRSDEG